MPVLERPRVDRVAVTDQLEQAWLAELLGGPLVHALNPRDDHRVVEQPTEILLVGNVGLDIARERIAVGEHAAEREEGPGHPEPWIAEHAAKGGESPYSQTRRPNKRVGIEDTAERDVHEEALRRALCFGELPMLQVGAHDARVVGSVPVARR